VRSLIVVTGCSGYVGGLVARELAARGEPLRLVTRDAARAPSLADAEVVVAGYGDPEALARALQPGDRVFMVSLHLGPEQRVPLHRSFVEAAVRARVAHVVYLSFVNAGPGALFLHARSHGATEAMLRESGLPFTFVRNGMYADDIPGWFDPDGVAREPGADARMSFSYRPELAEAIAVTLTGPGHENAVYDVTTPESVTLAELARLATEATGADYRYDPVDDQAWEARWRAAGKSGWELEAGRSVYEALRAGEFDVVGGDYRSLTGRAPLTVAQIVARLADELPLSAAASPTPS
jgi:NAD(P)H dehydrogenase (quinone)